MHVLGDVRDIGPFLQKNTLVFRVNAGFVGFTGLQDFRVGSGFRVLGLWDLRVEGVCVCVRIVHQC